jgi:hypothetical protein
MIAELLCLLAITPVATAETSWVLWQNVTVTTTDLDGSNPLSTTKWGPLGPADLRRNVWTVSNTSYEIAGREPCGSKMPSLNSTG